MAAPRDALSRERVLQSALAFADAHGLEPLSMRRLGAELGVEAMSLYRHVAGKDALLDAMVDAIVHLWVPSDTSSRDDDWRMRITAIMHTAHATLLAHPWAIELIAARPQVGEARLRYAEAVTSALLDAGFSLELAHHALHIVDGTITGFSAQEVHRPTALRLGARVRALYDGELIAEFPAISQTIRQHHDHAEEFALMVDLVIDGLDRLRSARIPRR